MDRGRKSDIRVSGIEQFRLRRYFERISIQARPRPLDRGGGVELGIIVQVILDNHVALAAGLFQAGNIDNVNFSARVFNQAFMFQCCPPPSTE